MNRLAQMGTGIGILDTPKAILLSHCESQQLPICGDDIFNVFPISRF